jgi:homocysteine S-methyltransferase
MRSLIHITCRDRNLIGLQSHLMGLDTLGLSDVLAITGDPSKIGDFPGATSVYDLTSFDLISLIKQFNEGLSYSGKPLGKKTNFSVAAAFNPNVRHIDKAVKRLEKKIACGADYFISQPVYSEEQLIKIHEETKHLEHRLYRRHAADQQPQRGIHPQRNPRHQTVRFNPRKDGAGGK